jgi:hypothetical protein
MAYGWYDERDHDLVVRDGNVAHAAQSWERDAHTANDDHLYPDFRGGRCVDDPHTPNRGGNIAYQTIEAGPKESQYSRIAADATGSNTIFSFESKPS